MYCPKCSEQQMSKDTRFCIKCGFKTNELGRFIESGGEFAEFISPCRKGIRQGAKLILLSIILFPIYIFLAPMFPPNDVLVESSPSSTWFEQIAWAIMTTLVLAGSIRILYAVIFEDYFAGQKKIRRDEAQTVQKSLKPNSSANALPPSEAVPVSNFGKWKTTDELFEPIFVKQKTSGELK